MRELFRDEMRWIVREVDTRRVPGARGERCLIYETDGVVRRVWRFPNDWTTLSDDALWKLIEDSACASPVSRIASSDAPRATAELPTTKSITELARVLFSELVSARDEHDESGGRRTRAEMRTAIQSYARSLRRQGIPPERVLVLLKDAVQTGLAGTLLDEPLAEAMMHDGVEWCIDAYFTS